MRYEWYALQRWGANYWEDFSRQKIVWKRIGSILRFSYDESGTMTLDSTCFATGKFIKYLLAVLNSKMGQYLLKDSPQTGTGDLLISVQAIEPLKIPIPDFLNLEKVETLMDTILQSIETRVNYAKLELEINQIIYKIYKLNKDEIGFVENQ